MSLTWPAKDPDEVLDYIVDWSSRTSNDHISNSAFTLSANSGCSIVANSFSNTLTTVWLMGGTNGKQVKVTNRIETVGGRTFEEAVILIIRAK